MNGITDEMIAKAALALRELPNLRGHSVAEVTRFAAVALDAGLAGCAVVDLPEPDEVDAENVGYWGDVYTGDFVSSRPPNGDPIDFLHGVTLGGLIRTGSLKPERAEQVAGWMLAAVQHVRQSAAAELSSGVGGDTR